MNTHTHCKSKFPNHKSFIFIFYPQPSNQQLEVHKVSSARETIPLFGWHFSFVRFILFFLISNNLSWCCFGARVRLIYSCWRRLCRLWWWCMEILMAQWWQFSYRISKKLFGWYYFWWGNDLIFWLMICFDLSLLIVKLASFMHYTLRVFQIHYVSKGL